MVWNNLPSAINLDRVISSEAGWVIGALAAGTQCRRPIPYLPYFAYRDTLSMRIWHTDRVVSNSTVAAPSGFFSSIVGFVR